MKLTDQEKIELQKLMTKYSNFSIQEAAYSKRLDEIDNERQNLLNEIHVLASEIAEVRIEEKSLVDMLITKYGEFRLDMETLEILPS